mmetsp:Transcript_26510/g.57457  ORF Transcript_26510/g.57457 Transcript_26510/m.57457 type:complete len:99 (-) Transcript_26510:299-595(-)
MKTPQVVGNAYPIHKKEGPSDPSGLMQKPQKPGYDAHVALVHPQDPSNAQEVDYVPCGPEDAGHAGYLAAPPQLRVFMEIVVFEVAQVFPWVVVELRQ